jgi:ADP-glucose pyrophosphorylase
MVEGSIVFEGAQVGKGTIAGNSIVRPGAIICRDCVVETSPCLEQNASWKKGTFRFVGARGLRHPSSKGVKNS